MSRVVFECDDISVCYAEISGGRQLRGIAFVKRIIQTLNSDWMCIKHTSVTSECVRVSVLPSTLLKPP